MIRLALMFAALLILTALQALGEWSELALSKGPDGFILFVDALKLPEEHRIVVAFPHLKDFTRSQIHPGTGLLIQFLIIEAEYDCHLERERVIKPLPILRQWAAARLWPKKPATANGETSPLEPRWGPLERGLSVIRSAPSRSTQSPSLASFRHHDSNLAKSFARPILSR